MQTAVSNAASSRPTDTLVIGGKTYTALAPKLAVWVHAVNEVNKALTAGSTLSAVKSLHDTLVGDDDDPKSIGILVQALDPTDFAELDKRLYDRLDDLDMDLLWYAAIDILGLFEDFIQARGKEMGLKVPRLTATRPKPAPAGAAPKPKRVRPSRARTR